MRVELVTSFSPSGADLYGRRCVDSVRAHWPHPVVVYTDAPMVLDGVEVRLTADIPDWLETRARLPIWRPDAPVKPTNYIWNAQRFAVKPFVWLDAATQIERGILVWLDGDTVTTASVPDAFIPDLMDGADVAFLGRDTMHPETGFVAFRLPEALPLLRRCVSAYLDGTFRSMPDGWTDCHVLRAHLYGSTLRARDMTSEAWPGEWRSSVDAFALSPLRRYVQHLKGPQRKREWSSRTAQA